MARHRVSMPPDRWPGELKARFAALGLGPHQERRLGAALGRWLLLAPESLDAPERITPELWRARTAGLPRDRANEIRQVLAALHPDRAEALYAGGGKTCRRKDPRAKLAATIAACLDSFPPEWRERLVPQVLLDPECLQDGVLIQAWAPGTVSRRLHAGARHFDLCREAGLPLDITRKTVRRDLQIWQARIDEGEARVTGASIHLGCLLALGHVAFPERDWRWLSGTAKKLKKLAGHQPSRNASRAVCAAELRVIALRLFEEAERAFNAARMRRDFVKAHTRARTALTMILLSEAPLRVGSIAALDLSRNLLGDLAGLCLDAQETKEGRRDARCFSRDLVRALQAYVARHRAVVARAGETRLLVGDHGGAVTGSTLSNHVGRATDPIFERRVTAHAIRHSVANYIVATAPEEAALATTILNHRDARVTQVYTVRAAQVTASRTLESARGAAARSLGVDPDSLDGKPATRRPPRRDRPRLRRSASRKGARPAAEGAAPST